MTPIVRTSHQGFMMGLVASLGGRRRKQPANEAPMMHQKSAYSLTYFVRAER